MEIGSAKLTCVVSAHPKRIEYYGYGRFNGCDNLMDTADLKLSLYL